MNTRKLKCITDGAFASLRNDVIEMIGLGEKLKAVKLHITKTVKEASATMTTRDPMIVEALSAILMEVWPADVLGQSKSGMSVDCRNGSAAATYWRTLVHLLPRVKAERSGKTAINPEKKALSIAKQLKAKWGKAMCRTLGALLMA